MHIFGFQLSTKSDGIVVGIAGKPTEVLGFNYTATTSETQEDESVLVEVGADRIRATVSLINEFIKQLDDGKVEDPTFVYKVFGTIAFIVFARQFRSELPFISFLFDKLKPTKHETKRIWKDDRNKREAKAALLTVAAQLESDAEVFKISSSTLRRELVNVLSDASACKQKAGIGYIRYRHGHRTVYTSTIRKIRSFPKWFNRFGPGIMSYELLAGYAAVVTTVPRNSSVILHVDNSGAAFAACKGSAKNILDRAIVAALMSFCRKNDISLRILYVSTKRNPADAPSRIDSIEQYLEQNSQDYDRISWETFSFAHLKDWIDALTSIEEGCEVLELPEAPVAAYASEASTSPGTKRRKLG